MSANNQTIPTEYYGQNPGKDDIKSAWWKVEDGSIFQHVFGVVNAIEAAQNPKFATHLKYARLYANKELLGFYGTLFTRTASTPLANNRITLNVIKACIDTAASKIAKNKPRPQFLTSGGDYSEQKKAKKLTKYIDGAFIAADVYTHAQKAFIDAGVFGTGVLKVYPDNDKICVERILPDEILVDEAEGMYGAPRQLHQRKYVHRDLLLEMFPKHEKAIRVATGGVKGDNGPTTADLVKVVESWHLPSGPEAKDGKHTICIENCTLQATEWDKEWFPFVFFRWCDRQVGFFGVGIAEELIGIQIEINKLLKNIQLSHHLQAIPRVWVDNASQVNTQLINNEVGSINRYTGTPPIFSTPAGMSPDVYNHLWALYAKAFEIVGISQMSATSKKPSGLNSGAALREYSDIESERFIITGQRWEKMFMDLSRMFIDLSRDLYEDNKDLKVKVKGKKFLETIKWEEVDLDEDKFIMQVFPSSALPTTPAGRLAAVTEYIQAGFMTKEQAMSLLDFPDLESFISVQTAAQDDISMLIERMIEDGVYEAPEAFMNLDLALSMTQSAYLRAKTNKVPEDRLELLRTFMDDCNTLLQLAKAPPEAPVPPPVGGQEVPLAPIAEPREPPTSELLPIK